jgi:hypothetical protein
VEVSVSDTGVGSAPEDREAIFEEFQTAAKKVKGTGLGCTARLHTEAQPKMPSPNGAPASGYTI